MVCASGFRDYWRLRDRRKLEIRDDSQEDARISTYDFFEVLPIVWFEFLIPSCQILSISRCQPGECPQLDLVCHAVEWWTMVSPSCLRNMQEANLFDIRKAMGDLVTFPIDCYFSRGRVNLHLNKNYVSHSTSASHSPRHADSN